MKAFEHDPKRTDPLAIIAAKDYEEFEIESIISHSGNPKRKSDMEFQVRWLGYDESEDLWLPWSEVRNVPALTPTPDSLPRELAHPTALGASTGRLIGDCTLCICVYLM